MALRATLVLLILTLGAGHAAATGPWQVEVKGRYGWPKARAGGTELFTRSEVDVEPLDLQVTTLGI